MFTLIFTALYAVYGELLFSLAEGTGFNAYKLFLALAGGAFLVLLGQLFQNRRLSFILQAVFCCLFSAFLLAQFLYYDIFKTPFILASIGGAADALDFFDVLWDSVSRNVLYVLAYLLQPVLLFTVYRRAFRRTERSAMGFAKALVAFVGVSVFSILVSLGASSGEQSPGYLMRYALNSGNAVRTLGVLPTVVLDFKCNVLGIYQDYADTDIDLGDVTFVPAPTDTEPEPTAPIESPQPTPEPTRYLGPNVLDIDFGVEAPNDTLAAMNAYFSQVEPTMQNAYTGMFEGYNLILLTAEGFSGAVIDPELTPTLYKMSTEGFVFTNFYTPVWGVSTSDGEYVATTGLIPKPGVWSYTKIADNYMPFGFGNQFAALGYKTMAFHNHTYKYYNRHLSYPTMGYEYLARGNGLEITDQWPESDREMMEKSVPMFVDAEKFHTYYMTVSGHMNYSFTGNMMSYIHRDKVADLPYSSTVKAYIACQLELEAALTNLIDQLEAAGVLDKTVIALSADHYPYGLTNQQYAELRGLTEMDTTFQLFENSFILWNSAMEGPVQVDKVCSSLDIAPTLSNLFGLPYDSRLYMGRDMLSDAPGLVVFQDRSFITDRLMYRSSGRKVTVLDAVLEGQELESYLQERINAVNDKFTYSARIIDNDYYGYLFGGD